MRLPLSPDQLKKILIRENLITSERFDELLEEAERKTQSVFDVLVAQNIVGADYLGNLVAKALGVERVDFSLNPVDREVVRLLPEEIARQRQAVVFRKEPDGVFDVAMVNPSDLETIGFLTQRLKSKIRPFLAIEDDLNRGFSIYGYESGQYFKKLIEENIRTSLSGQAKNIEEAAEQVPIVGIVSNLMSYAVASRASDIHIEILEDSMVVRYRIDGILYEVLNIAKAIHAAVVARIKLLAGLKIDEHLKPQDGRFRYQIFNQLVDVRVSVIPTYYGEKVEMRLLEATQKPLSLEELGMDRELVAAVARNLKSAYGMILSCGPTGSGKTTTLYAAMNILNKPEVNIVSIEDPIEYNMRHVNQMQISPQAGVTFASGLRSILRQDPNVIMVGEIRDAETAGIAVQAALTGHLLLSSLHTNDAPTAVPRLFDLQVPPFLVSSVLNLVLAQRLVRRICSFCIYSYEIGPDAQKAVSDQLKELGIGKTDVKMPGILYRGKGCDECGMTGYKGRLGIFEMLEVNDKIRALVNEADFNLDSLRAEARAGGMMSMFEDGLKKISLALTTMEELLRVIRE